MTHGPVVLVGLDACDPLTVAAMARRGELPTLQRALAHGATCRVANPHGLFVGALWMTFATGLDPVHHGMHSWDEIEVTTYERRLAPVPAAPGTRFWEAASEAGRRVTILDVPHTRADRPLNGLQVVEWGCHDRHFGLHSWPSSAATDIASAFGLHPVLGIDPYDVREFAADDYVHREGLLRTPAEDHALIDGLLAGLDAKRRLSHDLLREQDSDLFITVFGEAHAVGHQQWHLHDPRHVRFDPDLVESVGGDPLARVYRGLDGAVGELIDAAGRDATVFILLSHGMQPHYDGTHLLDAVLRRIDLVDRGHGLGRRGAGLAKRGLLRCPPSLQRRAVALATPSVRALASRRTLEAVEEFVTAEDRRSQRFFLEPNNYVVAGIRLNLAGREPDGCVSPDEVGRVVASLRDDLLALVNVATGEPVITSVEPADRWHPGRDGHDTMPDLFVEWSRRSPVETVWSPKIGLVHAPYRNWRTGDHRPFGELIAIGPDISTARHDVVAMRDIGPTLLARLDVPRPEMDGSPVPWLAGQPSSRSGR